MNPSHYPDLERCKKLTELGFPMTEKSWGEYKTGKLVVGSVIEFEYANVKELFIICPSVMEMMDVILSNKIRVDSTQAQGWLSSGDYIRVSAFIKYRELDGKGIVADTYPNALADLIVWLVENSHITFDKR